jgi:hypothetical protein
MIYYTWSEEGLTDRYLHGDFRRISAKCADVLLYPVQSQPF